MSAALFKLCFVLKRVESSSSFGSRAIRWMSSEAVEVLSIPPDKRIHGNWLFVLLSDSNHINIIDYVLLAKSIPLIVNLS